VRNGMPRGSSVENSFVQLKALRVSWVYGGPVDSRKENRTRLTGQYCRLSFHKPYSWRNRLKTFANSVDTLLSKLLKGRLPQNVIDPVENTAPPDGVSK